MEQVIEQDWELPFSCFQSLDDPAAVVVKLGTYYGVYERLGEIATRYTFISKKIKPQPPTKLILIVRFGTWLKRNNWSAFCNIIMRATSSMGIQCVNLRIRDHEGFCDCQRQLLEHLPPDLLRLQCSRGFLDTRTVCKHAWVVPCLRLQKLRFQNISAEDDDLAGCLQGLPALHILALESVASSNYSKKRFINTIRGNPNLREVSAKYLSWEYGTTNDGEPIQINRPWAEEEYEALQFGPQINAARRLVGIKPIDDNNEKYAVTLKDFVRLLAAVNDRVDCLHYLLSTMDPAICFQGK